MDKDTKKLLEDLGKDWEQFKTANDQRIEKLEAGAGGVDEIDEKLLKIGTNMDALEKERDEAVIRAKILDERLDEMEASLDGMSTADASKAVRKDIKEHADVFDKWMRSAAQFGPKAADPHLASELKRLEGEIPEYKDISTATGAAGGFAVPEEIAREIGDQTRVLSPVRDLVNVIQVGTSDFKKLLNVHGENSGWVGETDARAQGTTPTFRERTPTMGTLFAYPRATEESMDDVFFNVGQMLIDVSAEEFAIQEGTAVFLGSGTNRPTGLLDTAPTAADDDASPLRGAEVLEYLPIALASPPVVIDPDALFDMVYQLRERYTPNATWVMNRLTTAAVRKLKDGQSQYLWAPGLVAGEPNALLGFPHRTIGALANLAADSLSILFGDFKRGYILVDRVGLKITVDANITTPGFINWYIRKRVGGILFDNNAIKVGKFSIA